MVPIEGKCSAFCAFFVGILKQMLKGAPAAANRDRFANDQNRHRCCDRGSNLDTQDTYQDGLVVTKRLLADRPHLPHDVFEVSSAASTQSWYIDDTGAQFSIPTTCATTDEYLAHRGERVSFVTPVGALENLYERLCALPNLTGLLHSQHRESVRAVRSEIDLWSKRTNVKLPALLRLPDEKYAAQEKELLGMVRRSVKGFVLLWVGP
ncbi:hypothetical protein HBI55_127800 [Parastagonospora nodorum]|nr:hypothetical protein HBH95_065270 [Parastagonospora nodorum]KAH5333663.1 hypothetical protein HBI12_047900 [Parastagonospora nodorum]KAH5611063.1 hypothetical protein HBI45_059870 [Parastagonospora nodorum]KAH6492848.1 hypothetical protein HBI55_127800 [Parastagonospora nodorum]